MALSNCVLCFIRLTSKFILFKLKMNPWLFLLLKEEKNSCSVAFSSKWSLSEHMIISLSIFLGQSAILGMHSIVSRPMVVGGNVIPRPMMYIALTYDHRLIDGREAVFFLRRIKDVVEDPRRLLLDIWSLCQFLLPGTPTPRLCNLFLNYFFGRNKSKIL